MNESYKGESPFLPLEYCCHFCMTYGSGLKGEWTDTKYLSNIMDVHSQMKRQGILILRSTLSYIQCFPDREATGVRSEVEPGND